jgi:hypothetical protein
MILLSMFYLPFKVGIAKLRRLTSRSSATQCIGNVSGANGASNQSNSTVGWNGVNVRIEFSDLGRLSSLFASEINDD